MQWRIRLFGGVAIESGDQVITRFQPRKTAELLAYLAYNLPPHHPREHLAGLSWPEAEPDAARHSLSQALSSLRRQLEPPGILRGAVLVLDRTSVRLNPQAVTTDVAECEAKLEAAQAATSGIERAEL